MSNSTEGARGFTLGRERFAKIGAVAGLQLSETAQREFKVDENRQLAFAQRRLRILAKYARKK